ncbi:MAG: AAA family ATPase [Chloroflexota bacterium]
MCDRSTDTALEAAQHKTGEIVSNIEKVIVGKPRAIELSLITLLSQGHLLIEDSPGVGKTVLARSLARSVNCTFSRIQFTPDLLPGDITGVSIYNQKMGEFEFRPGPVMAQVVLADEINRATPKTQSALLECMDERRVSVDGVTRPVPDPFHVLATENPLEYEGTFSLPETQLDRFSLRLTIGYPTVSQEIEVMEGQQHVHPIELLEPVTDASELLMLQALVKEVYVDALVKEYIASLVHATRNHPAVYLGASPRGSLALFRTSQARALMHGRTFVLPDDVKVLAAAVLAHRLVLHSPDGARNGAGASVIAQILDTVAVPGALP